MEDFATRFATVYGVASFLASMPVGYWFSASRGQPNEYHLVLLGAACLFLLAVPGTLLLKKDIAWKKWDAAWRVFVLMLPIVGTMATFFFGTADPSAPV